MIKRGITGSYRNKRFSIITTTNEQAGTPTAKYHSKYDKNNDVCLACTEPAKKCKGTPECMEKHRRAMYGENNGKAKEDLG